MADKDDEETAQRANWGSQLEFILTCVGFAVGLGNVWRFPYLCFKNGGGAFLIPYFICMIFIGIPMFYLELCLGQFCSLGPLKVWRINPIFKGLGYAMITVSALVAIYYAVIIAYCLYFFVASMQSEVPWKYCDNNWNTCYCRDDTLNDSLSDPWNGTRSECVNINYTHVKSASDEYFNHRVLEKTSGMDDLQVVKWDLMLCNLFVWVVVFLVLSKGIKSLGKVVYFSAIFPYVLLTALLIRGLLLEGHMEGIKFYLTPDFSKLTEASVWSDAAVQIFYSLGTCQGGLMAMASYNPFKNNTLRDSLIIPVINCLTSFYSGFVIFSVLGFMAHKKNTSVQNVVDEGPGLAFVVYPEALSQMPISPLWAILFFIMMMTLGFSSLFSITETVITGLVDQMREYMEKTSHRLLLFRFSICALFFLLGLPMVTKGGMYVLNLVDKSVGGFPLLVVGLVEVVAILYVYGLSYKTPDTRKCPMVLFRGFLRFKSDIEMMLGNRLFVTIGFFFFAPTWCVITPLILLVVIVLKGFQYKPYTLDDYQYPGWASVLSWLIVAFPVVLIPAWMVYFCIFRDTSNMCKPARNWGPAFKENQTGLYAQDMSTIYEKTMSPATVLDGHEYEFTRKDTNEVNSTNIFQPYTQKRVMESFGGHDNVAYVNDIVEVTKL